MRTLKISLLVFILSITVSAQVGWFSQTSGVNNHILNVFFIDENFGWAVGDMTTILKTTNGGENWMILSSSGSESIYDVFFKDQFNGIIVGGSPTNSVLALTSNGGLSWVGRPSGTSSILSDVFFQDDNTGWIVGDWGVLLKTTNAGWNWTTQNSGTNNSLRGIVFNTPTDATIIGYSGTILHTTDGGQNWISQISGTSDHLWDITFINESNGWIVGDAGNILSTTDGGENWISQSSGTTNNLSGVSFTDENIGTIVGQYGLILRTTNGGLNWFTQTSGVSNYLYEVYFTDPLIGTAVGSSGTILRTINGGVPVELISFTTEVLENAVKLNWSTATETNNSGFEIQKTSPFPSPYQGEGGEAGRGWEIIGFVPGHGTTSETQHYSFTDIDVQSGKYQYKLKQIDYDGTFEYSQIVEVEIPFVSKFSLEQNYPNPFNPVTKINYSIPSITLRQAQSDIRVTLKVYDILGREVATLVNEEKPAGEYEVELNAAGLPSGIYFYQLQAGQFLETKKMVLMK